MNREDVIAKLRAMKPELARRDSISRVGIFGSVARGEARPDSDVDVIVEFDISPGYFEFVALQERLAVALQTTVDLFTPNSLHPSLREKILRETVYV